MRKNLPRLSRRQALGCIIRGMADEQISTIEAYRHNVVMIIDSHKQWRRDPSTFNTTRLNLMHTCFAGVPIGPVDSTPVVEIIIAMCDDYHPNYLNFFNLKVLAKWPGYSGTMSNPLGLIPSSPLWGDENAARQYAFADFFTSNLEELSNQYHLNFTTANKMAKGLV